MVLSKLFVTCFNTDENRQTKRLIVNKTAPHQPPFRPQACNNRPAGRSPYCTDPYNHYNCYTTPGRGNPRRFGSPPGNSTPQCYYHTQQAVAPRKQFHAQTPTTKLIIYKPTQSKTWIPPKWYVFSRRRPTQHGRHKPQWVLWQYLWSLRNFVSPWTIWCSHRASRTHSSRQFLFPQKSW